MKGYILYETDRWLSTSSKEVIGIFTEHIYLIKGIEKYIKDNPSNFKTYDYDDEPIEDMIERVMQEIEDCRNQTQKYERNLYIEKVDLNILI